MVIVLSKQQAHIAMMNYINEELNDLEFHALIKKLLREYSKWDEADFAGLFKPYMKRIEMAMLADTIEARNARA